jgi:hypothetical protein
MAEISYRRHRFSPMIIQHAVWLYLRFTLSCRDVATSRNSSPSEGSTSLTKPSGVGCCWRKPQPGSRTVDPCDPIAVPYWLGGTMHS